MEARTDQPRVLQVILGSAPGELAPERAAIGRALTLLRETTFPGLE
jgi:hypothetical protein